MSFIKLSPRFAGKSHLVVSQPIAGPFAEANSSQGYNSTWVFWVDSLNFAHLSILPNLTPETSPAPSYTLDVDWSDVRRVSCAVDQNSRRVVAWQKPAGITVSYIQTGTPETENRVTFSGFDPVLVWDGIMFEQDTNTDIILFYLNSARTSVKYRMQSELYLVEHNYVTLTEPATLDGFKIVGREICLGGQYELSLAFWETRTTLYPVYALSDNGSVGYGSRLGNYTEIIVVRDPYFESLAYDSKIERGAYLPLGQYFDDVTDIGYMEQHILTGEYKEKIVVRDSTAENSQLNFTANKGIYFLQILGSGDDVVHSSTVDSTIRQGVLGEVTIVRDTTTENVLFDSMVTRGSYLEVGQFFDPLSEFSVSTGRIFLGDYTLRSVQVDEVVDTALVTSSTNRGIYFESLVVRDVVNDNSTTNVGVTGGVLGESDRITYQTDSSLLNFGRTTGNLAQVNIKDAGDTTTDNSRLSFSTVLGNYVAAPTVFFFVSPQTPFINPTSDSEWLYFWGDWL